MKEKAQTEEFFCPTSVDGGDGTDSLQRFAADLAVVVTFEAGIVHIEYTATGPTGLLIHVAIERPDNAQLGSCG